MGCNILKCQFGSYFIPQRYVLCFMCFMAIVVSYSMRVCLNLALSEMVIKNKVTNVSHECPEEVTPNNPSGKNRTGEKYNWTARQQGIILSAFFPGYVITHIPGGMVSDLAGGRHILGACVILSGIVSILIPLTLPYGSWQLLTAYRFIMGAAQGVMFPAITTLLAKWVPKGERGTLGALVLTGPQVGSITGNLISGFLMADIGWPPVFYVWGTSGVVWYFFFLLLCFSEPSQHPFITTEERDMLAQEIGETDKLPIPWRKLIFYGPSLALMAGQIGHGAIFFFVVTDLPKYMDEVLKFNIKKSGILNALPYLALWFCACISGIIADKLINSGTLSVGALRKLYTTIASVGPSILCLAAVYMGCNGTGAAVMFILAMFLMGPFYPGMRVNALDITKNFAGILTAFVNGMGALAFIPIPIFIAEYTKKKTFVVWQNIFWLIFAIATVTNIIYIIWASGERAEWDKEIAAEEE